MLRPSKKSKGSDQYRVARPPRTAVRHSAFGIDSSLDDETTASGRATLEGFAVPAWPLPLRARLGLLWCENTVLVETRVQGSAWQTQCVLSPGIKEESPVSGLTAVMAPLGGLPQATPYGRGPDSGFGIRHSRDLGACAVCRTFAAKRRGEEPAHPTPAPCSLSFAVAGEVLL